MSFSAPTDRVLASKLPPHVKFVAVLLAMHANSAGDSIYPSLKRLADQANKTERSTRRAIRLLLGVGVLAQGTPDNPARAAGITAENWRAGGRWSVCYRIDFTALEPNRLTAVLDRWERAERAKRKKPIHLVQRKVKKRRKHG